MVLRKTTIIGGTLAIIAMVFNQHLLGIVGGVIAIVGCVYAIREKVAQA